MKSAAMVLFLAASAQEKPAPAPFEARGRLVCLAEEMRDRHEAEVAPVHEHLAGFRVEPKEGAGLRYYSILRTKLSEALFTDKRYQGRDLKLTGRVFPGSAVLEVTKFQWFKDGKLFDPYYWCQVCAIKSFDPGPCWCCQAPVEFRESAAEK